MLKSNYRLLITVYYILYIIIDIHNILSLILLLIFHSD